MSFRQPEKMPTDPSRETEVRLPPRRGIHSTYLQEKTVRARPYLTVMNWGLLGA